MFGLRRLLNGPVDAEIAAGGGDRGALQGDAVLFNRNRQNDVDRHRGVASGGHVDRLKGKLSAVALLEHVEPELGAKLVGVQTQCLPGIGKGDGRLIQVEMPDRRIDNGLKRRLAGRFTGLRRGKVIPPIGQNDDVGFRPVDAEVGHIDDVMNAGERPEISFQARYAQQGRGIPRFRAVKHEVRQNNSQMSPVEIKGPDLDFSASGVFGCRNNFLFEVSPEPVRLHNLNANHQDDGD